MMYLVLCSGIGWVTAGILCDLLINLQHHTKSDSIMKGAWKLASMEGRPGSGAGRQPAGVEERAAARLRVAEGRAGLRKTAISITLELEPNASTLQPG